MDGNCQPQAFRSDRVGGGYDFMLYEHFALNPFATFGYGDTGNWDYTVMTFWLGGTFR